jgi:sugar-specific transcriptional regulator TrmB
MNPTEYVRLIAFLKRFDCNHREAATYIECLQGGMASVQEIAQRLNSNRVTVHSTIQQLIKKGLIFETRKNRKRFIVAESPDVLHRILQRKTNELKLINNDLDVITKLLNSIQSHDKNAWKVRLYEGEEDFQKVLEETLHAHNGICVLTCNEFSKNKINKDYLNDYYQRIAEKGIHSRII